MEWLVFSRKLAFLTSWLTPRQIIANFCHPLDQTWQCFICFPAEFPPQILELWRSNEPERTISRRGRIRWVLTPRENRISFHFPSGDVRSGETVNSDDVRYWRKPSRWNRFSCLFSPPSNADLRRNGSRNKTFLPLSLFLCTLVKLSSLRSKTVFRQVWYSRGFSIKTSPASAQQDV